MTDDSGPSDVSALEHPSELSERADELDLQPDDVPETDIIQLALQAAGDADSELQYHGTKALSYLFQHDSSSVDNAELVDRLADHTLPGAERSCLAEILETATANIQPDTGGRTRGRAALVLNYVAAHRPARVSTAETIEQLQDLVLTGTRRIRRRRAVLALSKLARYDAPDRWTVRRYMADAIEPIRALAADRSKRVSQSVGLRALGYIALSFPEAVLPAEEIQAAVVDDALRPRNRNRALRALWQLSRSAPEVGIAHLETVVSLLDYSAADAAETNHKDGDDLERHAGWLRSNAAKTVAVIARDSPAALDGSVIRPLIDFTAAEETGYYRGIAALGELAETHGDVIVEEGGHETVARYVDVGSDPSTLQKHRRARALGVWALTRLAEGAAEEIQFREDHVDYLFAVADSEQLAFRKRRTEALARLADRDVTLLQRADVDDYLSETATGSEDAIERSYAEYALTRLEEGDEPTASPGGSERATDRLDPGQRPLRAGDLLYLSLSMQSVERAASGYRLDRTPFRFSAFDHYPVVIGAGRIPVEIESTLVGSTIGEVSHVELEHDDDGWTVAATPTRLPDGLSQQERRSLRTRGITNAWDLVGLRPGGPVEDDAGLDESRVERLQQRAGRELYDSHLLRYRIVDAYRWDR